MLNCFNLRGRLELREMRLGDLRAITPRADFAAEQRRLGEPLRNGPPGGLAYTLTRNGFPIACGGFKPSGASRWTAWTYTTNLTRREWAMVARAGRHGLRLLDERGIRTVEMIVLADQETALSYARQLGFRAAELLELPPEWEGASYRVMRREKGTD